MFIEGLLCALYLRMSRSRLRIAALSFEELPAKVGSPGVGKGWDIFQTKFEISNKFQTRKWDFFSFVACRTGLVFSTMDICIFILEFVFSSFCALQVHRSNLNLQWRFVFPEIFGVRYKNQTEICFSSCVFGFCLSVLVVQHWVVLNVKMVLVRQLCHLCRYLGIWKLLGADLECPSSIHRPEYVSWWSLPEQKGAVDLCHLMCHLSPPPPARCF